MTTIELTQQDLEQRYQEKTASIRCWCTLTSELVGGVPADKKALDAFAEYHLGIADPGEREKAVARILKEEIGERDATPEGGEVQEKQIYGVNVVRKTDDIGPWLGDWMVKAGIKQAASRAGVFQKTRGSKGNFSEAGRVRAIDFSLKEKDHAERIYLVNATTEDPAHTYFREFMGRVQGAGGAKSIVHHSECVSTGSRFAFEYRFLPGEVEHSSMLDVISLLGIVGCGSVRSLERGKYSIDKCELDGIAEVKAKSKSAKA
jgi:hypothetical protein